MAGGTSGPGLECLPMQKGQYNPMVLFPFLRSSGKDEARCLLFVAAISRRPAAVGR